MLFCVFLDKYMLFTGREVRIGKNCPRGLEYGQRLQAERCAQDRGKLFSKWVSVIQWTNAHAIYKPFVTSNSETRPAKTVLKNRHIFNYLILSLASPVKFSKISFSGKKVFFGRIWSCTTNSPSVGRSDSVEIKLFFRELTNKTRRNSWIVFHENSLKFRGDKKGDLGSDLRVKYWLYGEKTQAFAPLHRRATNKQTNSNNFKK